MPAALLGGWELSFKTRIFDDFWTSIHFSQKRPIILPNTELMPGLKSLLIFQDLTRTSCKVLQDLAKNLAKKINKPLCPGMPTPTLFES